MDGVVPKPDVDVLVIGLLVLFVPLIISIPRIVVGGGLVPLVRIRVVVMGVEVTGRLVVVVVIVAGVSGTYMVVGRSPENVKSIQI